ncbi:MAG: hypothetical protein JSV80_12735 [Acidobacteriota bacterium]|nr:MAG: hypothetical protein JSV80_12735 [Acidobacteriota bacterium]
MSRRRIDVFVLQLDGTLAREGTLFPHVDAALETFGRFGTHGGERPKIGLVHDSGTLDEDASAGEIREELKALGLARFFRRPSKQVVVSGSRLPDREAFADWLGGLGGDFDRALLLTGQRSCVRRCGRYGMAALRFARSSRAERDFGDWSEAPLVVAWRFFPEDQANVKMALQLFLEVRHGAELVSFDPPTPTGPLTLVAKTWQPLTSKRLGKLSGVHVRLPVQMRLEMQGTPRAVISAPDHDALEDVEQFVCALREHGVIQEVKGNGRLSPSVTHVVEEDSSGRRLLVRRRFSSR